MTTAKSVAIACRNYPHAFHVTVRDRLYYMPVKSTKNERNKFRGTIYMSLKSTDLNYDLVLPHAHIHSA